MVVRSKKTKGGKDDFQVSDLSWSAINRGRKDWRRMLGGRKLGVCCCTYKVETVV